MSDANEILAKVPVEIPVYRGNVEYALEMNDIDVTEENVQKATEIIKAVIAKMDWYNDEPIIADDAVMCIIEDNEDKF